MGWRSDVAQFGAFGEQARLVGGVVGEDDGVPGSLHPVRLPSHGGVVVAEQALAESGVPPAVLFVAADPVASEAGEAAPAHRLCVAVGELAEEHDVAGDDGGAGGVRGAPPVAEDAGPQRDGLAVDDGVWAGQQHRLGGAGTDRVELVAGDVHGIASGWSLGSSRRQSSTGSVGSFFECVPAGSRPGTGAPPFGGGAPLRPESSV